MLRFLVFNHLICYEPHPSHSKGESVGLSDVITTSGVCSLIRVLLVGTSTLFTEVSVQ
jgi:hypothetical protein